jgi:hypothetical protein
MEWIRRHKLSLAAGLAVSAVISIAELLWARSVQSIPVEPWQLGVLMLPWFTTAGTLLSLCYLLWFGQGGSGWLLWLGKLVFWSITAMFTVIFVVIYGSHVLGIF